MTTYSALVPVANQGMLYITDMIITNNATTPNTQIDVGPGLCRDSTDTYDINLGNYYASVPVAPPTINATTTIDATVKGANGIDTGTLAASTLYYIHVIFDNTGIHVPACLISLSRTAPTLPFGYSNFRWIGQMRTDGSVHFLKAYSYGQGNLRYYTFDAPLATAVTAGTSATYAAVALTNIVPVINNIPVLFQVNWSANGAGNTFNMQPGNGTGDAFTAVAPVAAGTGNTWLFPTVMAQLVAGVITSNYKVSAVGGVAINVAGYWYSL